MNTIGQLIQYGLSGREAKMYLFLIEHIEESAHTISKGTGIPRATVYLVLENLKKKGLVSVSKKNNVSYFMAESPKRLQKIIEEKLVLTDALVPYLQSLTHTHEPSPSTKIYTGKEGLKVIFDDILETLEHKKIKQLQAITDSSLLHCLPKYLPDWIRKREKMGVFTQMISESDTEEPIFKTNALREVRLFPPHVSLDCSIDIYGDKIACISIHEKEIYGEIIHSSTIANTIRQLFFVVWESLTPTPPNMPR